LGWVVVFFVFSLLRLFFVGAVDVIDGKSVRRGGGGGGGGY